MADLVYAPIMVPTGRFDTFADGQPLTVEGRW